MFALLTVIDGRSIMKIMLTKVKTQLHFNTNIESQTMKLEISGSKCVQVRVVAINNIVMIQTSTKFSKYSYK